MAENSVARKRFPERLIVHIENQGTKDEYFHVVDQNQDLVAIGNDWEDGQRVGIYKLVGVKTVKKAISLEATNAKRSA